jgi:low affinity Fe/Cu permease
MLIAIVENDSSFGVVAVRLNEKVAAIAFYAILVVSILIFGFGITFKDNMIIGIGISLFICAFLVKSEFKLEVLFWKNR